MPPFTLFDGSVKYAKASVSSLINILKVAEQHAPAEKVLQARLHEDMNPMSFQIFAVSVIARKSIWRLDGAPDPMKELADLKLETYEAMYAHLQETIKLLDDAEAHRDSINAVGEATEMTEIGGPMAPAEVSGKDFIYGSTIPNLTFHLNMAYAILRKEGVPLAKKDYLEPFMGVYMPQVLPKESQAEQK